MKDQLQSFMLMFVGRNLVKLLAEFPPKEHSEPVLSKPRMGPRSAEIAELEAETTAEQEIRND